MPQFIVQILSYFCYFCNRINCAGVVLVLIAFCSSRRVIGSGTAAKVDKFWYELSKADQ